MLYQSIEAMDLCEVLWFPVNSIQSPAERDVVQYAVIPSNINVLL